MQDAIPIITAAITALGAILVAWMNNRFKNLTEQITQLSQKIDETDRKTNSRIDVLESRITKVAEHVSKIDEVLEDNNLRTMRLDLVHAIDTDPDNTMVIMDLAHKYFVEMKGNCYMSKKFQEWAQEHNVNITSLFNKD